MLRRASSSRPRCACVAANIAQRDHWMFGSCTDRSADSTASSSRPQEEVCFSASHQELPEIWVLRA
jgi:hypothetical protein